MMAMIVVVIVIVIVVMMIMMVMVIMVVMVIPCNKAALTSAERGAERAVFNIASRGRNTFTFHVVMVAFLGQADFVLKPEHLGAIFAHGTVHVVTAGEDFPHPISKSGNHLIVIVKISGLDEFNVQVTGGDFIGKAIDAVNENA